ncbi:hypothetical protein BN59_01330 [Legionella massiliensis]|uniref:Flagellar biosynthetic protein FliO n=1 Tax=Legionella massiliensis TaxID=1034943 RepID=A0A078KVP0_9GAMM|nr:hypothetical protein [Legionella massiliensis]CDZ77051.1 hypothetical protein BN59_01330 [Legionella massiliensis]CEE12789.1 hypothetical protein BN1094_01330 [Legionella massiliensis]
MRKIVNILLASLVSNKALAEDLHFKQAIEPKQGWFIYLITLAALIALAIFLAKKPRQTQSSCLIVDKKHLGNKTTIYILEYQNQQFLLADSQQALALHALTTEKLKCDTL